MSRPQGGQDHDRRGGKEGQENAKFQRRKPGPRRRKSGETPKAQGTPVSALSSLIGNIFQEASNLDRPDNKRKVFEMLGNVFLEWYEMT